MKLSSNDNIKLPISKAYNVDRLPKYANEITSKISIEKVIPLYPLNHSLLILLAPMPKMEKRIKLIIRLTIRTVKTSKFTLC